MAVAFRTEANGASSTAVGTIATTAPAGRVSGDLLLLSVTHQAASVTTPTGWTSCGARGTAGTGATLLTVDVFYRFADGSATDTPTLTLASSVAVGWNMLRYDGVASVGTLDGYATASDTTAGSNIVAPAVTTAKTDSVVISTYAGLGGVASITTAPASSTQRSAASGSTGSNSTAFARLVYDRTTTTSGSNGGGTLVYAQSTSTHVGVSVALRAGGQSQLTYTGADQTYVVPAGVTSLDLSMKGSSGSAYNAGGAGGAGGAAGCRVAVTPGESLTVVVGSGGITGAGATTLYGGAVVPAGSSTASGGGYVGVFRGAKTQANALVIAAGGGGSGNSGNGGAGGGTSGAAASGGGGTQSAGGAAGNANATAGSALLSGAADSTGGSSGGGGAGYYGGGGGATTLGGGGGSSFTTGTNVTNTSGGGAASGGAGATGIAGTATITAHSTPLPPTITAPNGGETIDTSVTVTWTAGSSPDGNAITYDLDYSLNNGSTWTNLITGTSALSYAWNTSAVAASTTALVRVRATDTFSSSAYDPSNAVFTITHVTAPNAPTLNLPANASYQDLAAGYTFTWTFSDPNVGDTQAAYAFRRKISGAGAYEYWNAGTGAWQGTAVWNNQIASSLAFTAGKWTDGNVYNWSVATQDQTSLQGPFAADATVSASGPPSVAVTAPTGAQVTQTPTVNWSTTVQTGLGSAQTAYRVVVESGTFGATPGSGTSQYDSGTVTSTAMTLVLPTLTNAVSYRAFVAVTETGGQVSSWGFSSFSVALDAPAQPVLTATWDAALQRAVLAVQGRDNLLSTNAASIETDASAWTAGANTAVARSTAQFLNGVASLSLTSTAAGSISASTATGVSGVAVLGSTAYEVLASFRTAATGQSWTVAVAWYTAAGALISTSTSPTVTDTSAGWTQAALAVTSPVNAAFAAVVLTGAASAASEVHYADAISLAPGTSTTWTRGGLTGTGTVKVERSADGGLTWAAVRGASAAAVPAPTQQVTVYDYEVLPTSTVQYRASVTDVV